MEFLFFFSSAQKPFQKKLWSDILPRGTLPDAGSIPATSTKNRATLRILKRPSGHSSVGRAPAFQAGGTGSNPVARSKQEASSRKVQVARAPRRASRKYTEHSSKRLRATPFLTRHSGWGFSGKSCSCPESVVVLATPRRSSSSSSCHLHLATANLLASYNRYVFFLALNSFIAISTSLRVRMPMAFRDASLKSSAWAPCALLTASLDVKTPVSSMPN